MRTFCATGKHRLILWAATCCVLTFDVGGQESEEPFATVSPEFQNLIEMMMQEDLPDNVYEWNITEIYNEAEEEFGEGFWCTLDSTYFTQFPTEVLDKMPSEMKWCQEWYCLIPEEELAADYNSTYAELGIDEDYCEDWSLSGSLSGCPYPFVDVKTYSPYPGGCGVACKYAGLVYGFNDAELRTSSNWKIVMCSIAFFFGLIVFVNQYLEWKERHEYFCQKPLLSQSGIMITVAYAGIMLIFLGVEVIGVNRVICDPNGDSRSVISLNNPRSGHLPCALCSATFFVMVLLLCFYTALFSVALFDTLAFSFGPRPWYLQWVTTLEEKFGGRSTFATRRGASGRRMECKEACTGCMKSNKAFVHGCIWLTVVVWVSMSLVRNAHTSYAPMGVCYPGSASPSKIFKFGMLPMLMALVVIGTFLPASLLVLWRTMSSSSNENDKKQLLHFHIRLTLFLVGIVCSWVTLCIVSFQFWLNRKDMHAAAEERLICAVVKNLEDIGDCYGVGFRVAPVWHILSYVGVCMAAFSSMLLGCREKTLDAWVQWLPCLEPLLRCTCTNESKTSTAIRVMRAMSLSKSKSPRAGNRDAANASTHSLQTASGFSSKETSSKQFESATVGTLDSSLQMTSASRITPVLGRIGETQGVDLEVVGELDCSLPAETPTP